MTPKPTPAPLHDQMAHLLTGNLRGLSALRLRRRIARDPALAREWNELQAVASRLKQTPLPASLYPAPRWATPRTLDLPESVLRKRALKRGLAVVVALALPISGTIAFLALGTSHATFQDRKGHLWVVESYFPGKVRLYDEDGILLGDFSSSSKLAFLHAPNEVLVSINGQPAEPKHDLGVHALHTATAGYVELCDPYERDDSYDPTQDKEVLSLYNWDEQGPFVTNRAATHGMYRLPLPGLYTAVDRRNGLAYKVQGEASISIRFPNALPHSSWMSGASAPSKPIPAKHVKDFPVLMEVYKRDRPLGTKPLLFWSMAAPTVEKDGKDARYLMVDGRWLHPWRSGTFSGYGKHTVRNDKGDVLIVFDVQPFLSKVNMAGPPPRR